MRHIRNTVLLVAALSVAFFAAPLAPAAAADPGTPGAVVFVSAGNIYRAASAGAPAVQATTGGGYAWPRLTTGFYDEVAYLYQSNLYLGNFDGSGHLYADRQLTAGGHTGPASWSPDGFQISYIQDLSYPLLSIVHLGTAGDGGLARHPNVQVLSTSTRRIGPAAKADVSGTWSTLRSSLGVAWEPNGQGIAFPGGDCLGVDDDCLSVLDLATNVEHVVAAWGGGGNIDSGYATDPAWSADSAYLYWNQQVSIGGVGPISPIQVWTNTGTKIGHDGDSQPAPSPAADGSLLVSAAHNGTQWVTKIAPNGARTYLYKGYEEDWGIYRTF